MTCFAHQLSERGREVYELGNELVRVTVSPAEGGKIRHLVNRSSGRDYCWQMPDPPQTERKLGLPYPQADSSGIDECLPTIEPCRWNGRDLPDHGEVWTEKMDARWTERGDQRVALSTSVDLPVSPMRFERTIDVREGSPVVTLAYALTSTSDRDQDYLWALHPLTTFRPGERLILPGVSRVVSDKITCESPLKGAYREFDWPVAAETIDLSNLQAGPLGGSCAKVFSDKMQYGWAALHDPQRGDLLAFLFDPGALPYVGVWINRGGWGGYEHVAIEPTTGRPDALDVAAGQWKSASKLPAGKTVRWQVRILLATHPAVINNITYDGTIS